ncbi:MAG: septum formation protein Maf [Kiritimatiellae bacterium]|nr:septum formation protein Maf [Kiritimatiellia bacterium]
MRKGQGLAQRIQSLFGGRPLILASGSPRRRVLLQQLGLAFTVDPPQLEEEVPPGAAPEEACIELARRKAKAVSARHARAVIVSADTVVVLDGRILGKPRAAHEAADMLRSLGGRTHTVLTGLALLFMPEGRLLVELERTAVAFAPLSREEIDAYVGAAQPFDKAGGYGIQDTAAVFVTRVEGCFYNVVGFPLACFYRLCRAAAEPVTPQAPATRPVAATADLRFRVSGFRPAPPKPEH